MKKTGLIAGFSFLAGAVFFAMSFGFFHHGGPRNAELSPEIALADSVPLPAGGVPNFVPIVKRVKPAVVQVVSDTIVERRSPFGDDFFDQFFNVPRQRERRQGMGAGFFISADGYILTNNHVVKDAVKVKVLTIDQKEYPAKVIGTDPKTDLALLKVDVKNFPFIMLGDSGKVEVGEWVLAIGNPLGQAFTVTSGIISAEGRQLGMADIEDFLQTDAAINMGNSGGPLINMRGEAIGINSSILTPNQGSIGIGFSIPSNMAKKVVADLKGKGKVVRGWFGISMNYLTDSQAKEYDIGSAGALVMSVEEGSPAARAGLKRYDLIVAANGKKINSAIDLQQEIANSNPGDTVEVQLIRNNRPLTLKVKVSEAPTSMRIEGGDDDGSSIDLGMIVEKNSSALARQYELKTSAGILVKKVQQGGIAAANQLRAGDVILGVNRTEITSVEQFGRIMSGKQPGSSVLMLINRGGNESMIRFEIPEE